MSAGEFARDESAPGRERVTPWLAFPSALGVQVTIALAVVAAARGAGALHPQLSAGVSAPGAGPALLLVAEVGLAVIGGIGFAPPRRTSPVGSARLSRGRRQGGLRGGPTGVGGVHRTRPCMSPPRRELRVNSIDVLVDAFGRVRSDVHRAVDGLDERALNLRLDGDANPVGWLVWHLTRVQDDHLADLAGTEQAYTASRQDGASWVDRFGFDLDPTSMGFGHSPAQVAAVHVADPALLTGYYDAVHEQTVAYLRTLSDTDLDDVIDDAWDPPVTRGVRIISVVDDDIQHAGQAAFVAGIARRAA